MKKLFIPHCHLLLVCSHQFLPFVLFVCNAYVSLTPLDR
jgi:hypothetical protein